MKGEQRYEKAAILVLCIALAFACVACGDSSTDGSQADGQKDASKTVEKARDLPEGDYEEIGDGSFYLTGPSGSTENGDEIILYPDKDTFPHAYVGYELLDMDGSVQTYIYVDGVEMDKQQVGDGYESSIDFGDEELWAITDGEHTVEAVQYADNDTSKDMTFYRSAKYTVKNN